MVFHVRCYKCGKNEVRLVLGGRSIIHARCHGCNSNLLAEIMEFEQQVLDEQAQNPSESPAESTSNPDNPPGKRSAPTQGRLAPAGDSSAVSAPD